MIYLSIRKQEEQKEQGYLSIMVAGYQDSEVCHHSDYSMFTIMNLFGVISGKDAGSWFIIDTQPQQIMKCNSIIPSRMKQKIFT